MAVTNKSAFDVLTAQEYNDLIALARPIAAFKPSDQSNATTTFQDDSALQVTLAAATTYEFRALLAASVPTATDIKFQWVTVGAPTGWWTVKNQTTAGALETAWQGTLTWSSNVLMEGFATGDRSYEMFGTITTTTGGLFKLQWAANAAGTVTVRAMSMIKFLAS